MARSRNGASRSRHGVSYGGRDIGPCTVEGCGGQRRVAFTDDGPVVACSRCAYRGAVDWLKIHAEMTRMEAA
jgi:hypothetical protein